MGHKLRRYGEWALVTGASSGLGLEFARRLAGEGLGLVLVARRLERLERLAEELRQAHGIQVLAVDLDLSRVEAVDQLQRRLEGRRIDLAVLNAGYGYYGSFVEQPEEDLERMISLNCTVTALLAHRLLPPMIERRRGALILVSSVLGFLPGPWIAAYSATKAFDLMLGESLGPELRRSGVDLLNLCPGSTRTEFHLVAGRYGHRGGEGPTPLQSEPGEIVELALKNLGRKLTVYPGQGRLAALVTRLLPRAWTAALTGRLMERRYGRRDSSAD